MGLLSQKSPGREQYRRGPVQLGWAVSRLEPERPVADAVEFGPGQARLERDGPVDLVGCQRGQRRARQAGGDVGGVVGIEPGRVQQLPGDLLRSGATGHHAGAGAGEGGPSRTPSRPRRSRSHRSCSTPRCRRSECRRSGRTSPHRSRRCGYPACCRGCSVRYRPVSTPRPRPAPGPTGTPRTRCRSPDRTGTPARP